MTGIAPTLPLISFADASGGPLANGTVTVYLAGTTTLTQTWQDPLQTALNTNPIVLDARGSATVFLSPELSYKFLVKDSLGNNITTIDNIASSNSGFSGLIVSNFGPNNQAAIEAAYTAGFALSKTVVFTPGVYTLTNGIFINEFVNTFCYPGVIINYTGTGDFAFTAGRGAAFIGNGVTINCTNAAWNGRAVLVDGGRRYAADYPAIWDGVNIKGPVGLAQGTGLALIAPNATNFISFAKFSNFAFHELNFGLTIDAGSSGSAGDPLTWHFINGNHFTNFIYYGTQFGININGLPGVPAEADGNIFVNHSFQVSNTPLYVNGGTNNRFVNFYVFDWNYGIGDAIQFIGGAFGNFVESNIRVEGITGSATNLCETPLGEFTGNRIFKSDVDIDGYCVVKGKIETGGTLWVQNTNLLQLGGNTTRATIENVGGNGTFRFTPSAGNNITLNSEVILGGRTDPNVDNTFALGRTVARYTTIHLSSAPTITSDEREKDHITEIPDAVLTAWSKVNFCQFKMHGSGKWRFGVVAQRVKESFESEGLDPFAYGLLCFDQWDDVFEDGKLITPAGSRYGIIYEEALILECALLRRKLQ